MRSKLALLTATLAAVCLLANTAVADLDAGYKELQRPWQAVELVDNGRTIAPEATPRGCHPADGLTSWTMLW